MRSNEWLNEIATPLVLGKIKTSCIIAIINIIRSSSISFFQVVTMHPEKTPHENNLVILFVTCFNSLRITFFEILNSFILIILDCACIVINNCMQIKIVFEL